MFKSIEAIEKAGYKGFTTTKDLAISECKDVPKVKGIYFVLNTIEKCHFLTESVGGHFKKKNPTVALSELKSNWVEDTIVIYIGQAGGGKSNATLYSRLKQYMKFGQGQPVGHWGGRLIWQLRNHKDLLICWKTTPEEDPRLIEKNLIHDFTKLYSKRPYANLRG
ncbi:MAG: hypothetical protein FVQ80_05080 [Planctomycetes bacterium]|nr:hypothetical protein [Planctomycetota bacterium]